MNIRINFAKLLREKRPLKIKQQYNFLNHVCNKTAPDNALITYFFALQLFESVFQHSQFTDNRPLLAGNCQLKTVKTRSSFFSPFRTAGISGSTLLYSSVFSGM